MLTKENVKSLKRYLEAMKDKRFAPVPLRHCGHSKTYIAFLDNEIAMVKAKLESAELEKSEK